MSEVSQQEGESPTDDEEVIGSGFQEGSPFPNQFLI